jgi:hypothetical protein
VPGGNARVAASPFLRTTTVKAPRVMAFTGQAESGGMKYSTAWSVDRLGRSLHDLVAF